MAVVCDVLGLAIVGAERDPVRPVLGEQRQERRRFRAAEPSRISSHMPRAQPLAALLDRVRLVVGADAGRRVRVRAPRPSDAGRVPVDVLGERELRELGVARADHAGEVHHLGEADHAPAAQQRVEVAGVSSRRGDSNGDAGHARRRHEVDVERQPFGRVDQPVHAVGAEHVRDLVRIGDDGRRPERQHEARERVDAAASTTRGACARR